MLKVLRKIKRTACWRKLGREDIKIVHHFVKQIYSKTDPVSQALKISEYEASFFADQAVFSLQYQQSLCAFDPESKDIFCVAIISGPHRLRDTKVFDTTRKLTLKQLQINEAFATLSRGLPKDFENDVYMRGEFVVTEPDYAQLGIASALIRKSLQLAKKQEVKRFLSESTSAYSARIRENLGVVCLSQIRYSDYSDPFTKERILSSISKPHDAMKLLCHSLHPYVLTKTATLTKI